jgi:hypothetical protein
VAIQTDRSTVVIGNFVFQCDVSLEAFFAEGKVARVVRAEATEQWLWRFLIKTLPLHVLDELVITLERSAAGIANVIRLSAKPRVILVSFVCLLNLYQINDLDSWSVFNIFNAKKKF